MQTAQHAEHKHLFLAGVEKHLASMNPEHQTSQFLTEEKFGRIQSVLEQWEDADDFPDRWPRSFPLQLQRGLRRSNLQLLQG